MVKIHIRHIFIWDFEEEPPVKCIEKMSTFQQTIKLTGVDRYHLNISTFWLANEKTIFFNVFALCCTLWQYKTLTFDCPITNCNYQLPIKLSLATAWFQITLLIRDIVCFTRWIITADKLLQNYRLQVATRLPQP